MPNGKPIIGRPIIDIGTNLTVLDKINTIPPEQFVNERANLMQAVQNMRSHLTDQETKINDLNTTIVHNTSTINDLNTQNFKFQQDTIANQKIIDDLKGKLATATAAPQVKPLDLANSFKNVVDTIQQQARQQPTGSAITITEAHIEIKALVGISGTDTVMILPTVAAPLDPNQLSTLRVSFAAIPKIPGTTGTTT